MSIKKISILTTKKARRTEAKIISLEVKDQTFQKRTENQGKKENTQKGKNLNIKQ
jgi:hypothetical protein